MTSDIRIRAGTVDDAGIIVHHRRLMFEEMGFEDPGPNDEMDATSLATLLTAIPSGEYRAWLAEDASGAVIAGAGLTVVRLLGKPFNPSGAYAYLMSLYVEPPFRRRGIARALMRTMIDWARNSGLAEVKLHASLAGRSMYEGLGFEPTNEMRLLLKK